MTEPELPYACRSCTTVASFRGDCERMPEGCPTRTRPDLTRDVASYLEPVPRAQMQIANDAPFDASGRKRTRVEELIFYAERMGHRKVGIAFCVSMIKEAQELVRQLEAAGLEGISACCRAGAVDHFEIGLPKQHPERFAAICNPIAQARLLEAAGAQLVVNMGLCIGHDLLLQEYSKAPVTTLVVKDRVHDHQPIAALRPGAPA